MASFRREIFTLSDLLSLRDKGVLTLQPKFQRREFWHDEARAFLIDTVLRDLPMPKVYLRRSVKKETGQFKNTLFQNIVFVIVFIVIVSINLKKFI